MLSTSSQPPIDAETNQPPCPVKIRGGVRGVDEWTFVAKREKIEVCAEGGGRDGAGAMVLFFTGLTRSAESSTVFLGGYCRSSGVNGRNTVDVPFLAGLLQ